MFIIRHSIRNSRRCQPKDTLFIFQQLLYFSFDYMTVCTKQCDHKLRRFSRETGGRLFNLTAGNIKQDCTNFKSWVSAEPLIASAVCQTPILCHLEIRRKLEIWRKLQNCTYSKTFFILLVRISLKLCHFLKSEKWLR